MSMMTHSTSRTAIYICDCAGLISDHVDTDSLEILAGELANVVLVRRVPTLCTQQDLDGLAAQLQEAEIDRLLVAACSPRMSLKLPEERLMAVARQGGLDPCLVEVANIREQCAWVHRGNLEGASRKARDMLRMAHARLVCAVPSAEAVEVERSVLVVGGGAAGLATARHLARSGIEAVVVERDAYVGGALCQLAFIFQTESWPATCKGTCIGPVQANPVLFDPRVQIHTSARVERLEKRDGNFSVTIHEEPRYVDVDRCISCGLCAEVCPEEADNEFELGRSKRKAISKPWVRAVPDAYSIVEEACTKCGECPKVCPTSAIDLEATERQIERTVGAVVLASGTRLREEPELKNGPDVLNGMEFERMLDTEIVRPSDGERPEQIVFVQCAGSRAGIDSPRSGVPYCSKTCCSITAKQIKRLATNHPDIEASVIYYRDFRTYERALEKLHQDLRAMGVEFHNGEVTDVVQRNEGGLQVRMDALDAEDQDEGVTTNVDCDLVVLACAQEPRLPEAARELGMPLDLFGFPIEHQPRVLRPTETFVDRVFAVGSALGPKTIQQAVEQGKAASLKAIEALAPGAKQPVRHLSEIDPERCSRCGVCVSVCPHGAIQLDQERGARPDAGFCQGCGLCAASCPSHAASLRSFSHEQLLEEVRIAFSEAEPGEPRLLALLCYWCAYAGVDLAGVEALSAPDCYRTLRIRCSCSVNMGLILEIFRMGVDGIVVAGCPHNSCHHMWGNWIADKQAAMMKQLMNQVGIDDRRLSFENIGLMHAREFVALMRKKRQALRDLGPNPWATGSSVVQGAERSWLAR
jgi:heterodisulfide reductase subunit A